MAKISKSWIVLGMVFIVSLLTTGEVIAAQGETIRVSVDQVGNEGNNQSEGIAPMSSDGQYVAFTSSSTNLVPDDTNGMDDVFVYDRQTGQTTRVSVDSAGVQGNGTSFNPSISSDGRFVAFMSLSNNLMPNDTNGMYDVFVHDRQTGQTMCVSVDSAGVPGNHGGWYPSISSDGRYVAFSSSSTNLVPDDSNGMIDVFVHDRQTGQTTRVSVDSAGAEGDSESYAYPSISSDGRYVAFESAASNLVPDDTNDTWDVFVHDRQTGQTTRVSVDSAGVQGDGLSYFPSISSDGRYVAFESLSTNLVPNDTNDMWDIFVHDRQTGQTSRDFDADGDVDGSDAAALTANSSLLVITTFAQNFGKSCCP
jgi:Tol biopolymer transport system component